MRVKSPQQADKILTAAAQLFANHRFHEARMEDIAALAEVGKGTLYRYFKDKEALYLALLARAGAGLRDCLSEALQCQGDPREQLVAVVAALIDYFDAQPHLFDLIQHAEVMHRPGQPFAWQERRNETLGVVKDLFRAGARAGQFTIDDPELAALMLLGGLRGVVRFGARPRPAALAETVVAGVLGGHARREGRCAAARSSTSPAGGGPLAHHRRGPGPD